MILRHIFYFQLSCRVLPDSPLDQGHLTYPQLDIRRTFCDLSPFLSFSPCLSGFGRFFQIVISCHFTGDISRAFFSISSNLVIFWAHLPFSPFWSGFCLFYQIRHFTKKIFWSLISICVNTLVIFLARVTTFHPPDRFSPFPPDSSFFVRSGPFDQGRLTGDLSRYLTFSPFLSGFRRLRKIRHLTRDIAPILN